MSDQPTEASAPPQLCVTCKTPMITKRQVVDRLKCDNFDCVDCGRTQREYNVAHDDGGAIPITNENPL